jgi:pSer/pThr/pTyr-binding forkhead associated (FHA) protein
MLRKAASPREQPLDQAANYIPVLSTRHHSPSVREIFRLSSKQNQAPSTQHAEPATSSKLIITASFLNENYEVFLEKDTITLGEADSNDILLAGDHMTAPCHALLKKQDGNYYLFEGRSKGGVFVNGQRLVSGLGFKLADGDQLAIGQYRLIFSSVPTQNRTKPGMSISIPRRFTLPVKHKS